MPVRSVSMPKHIEKYLKEKAENEGINVSKYIVSLIEKDMHKHGENIEDKIKEIVNKMIMNGEISVLDSKNFSEDITNVLKNNLDL